MTHSTIQNRKIINKLDTRLLEAGEHQFWFEATTNGVGQPTLLPVIVYKSQNPGPTVMVSAGVHGDELNGVLTAQQIAREVKGKLESGCLVILPALNLSGMLAGTRDFVPSDPDASPANLNRYFPGRADGDAANRYLHQVWTGLLEGNADFVIDLHTQTRGATYPLYVFADFRLHAALEMARLMNPDVILNDPGDAGVLETVWNESGVPCITVEVGTGKITQPEYIGRAVAGIKQILVNKGLCGGIQPEVTPAPLEGHTITSIRARQGGFVLCQTQLLEQVKQGQLVAVQYDLFGDVTEEYHAPHDGTVLSLNSDSLRDPGALLVRLITK